jgi:CheY-like chemotaxis protein
MPEAVRYPIGKAMRVRFVLVAETNNAFVALLRKELANTGYALVLVRSGQQAIEYLKLLKADIDLVIIDLDIPGVSGIHVIWRLMTRKKHPKIIATTEVEIPLLKHVLKELGTDAVVQIPIPVQDLRNTIQGVLRSRFPAQESRRCR